MRWGYWFSTRWSAEARLGSEGFRKADGIERVSGVTRVFPESWAHGISCIVVFVVGLSAVISYRCTFIRSKLASLHISHLFSEAWIVLHWGPWHFRTRDEKEFLSLLSSHAMTMPKASEQKFMRKWATMRWMDGNEKTEFASWGVAEKGWLLRHFAIVNEVCCCTQGKEMVVSTDDNRFRRMFFYCPFETQSQSVTSSRMLLTGIPSRWCRFLCLFNLVRFYLVNDWMNSSKRWFNALACEIHGWVVYYPMILWPMGNRGSSDAQPLISGHGGMYTGLEFYEELSSISANMKFATRSETLSCCRCPPSWVEVVE